MTNAAPSDYALFKRFTAEYTQASPKTPKKAVYERIAATLGLTADSVRGRVSRARRATEQSARTIQIPSITPPTPDVEADDLYWPSARDENDLDKWRAFVDSWRGRERMMRVLFLPDLHIPDHNAQAVKLALQVARAFAPDVVIWLGDEFDFDKLSLKFPRSSARKQGDVFKEVGRAWNDIIDRFEAVLPGVPMAMVAANHTKDRVEKLVNELVPMLDDTIIEAFIELARAKRRVWWLGWNDSHWLGSLLIEHGRRTGENAAKNALKDVHWSVSRVGGHVHYPSEIFHPIIRMTPKGIGRVILQSVTLPCLCNLHPHYGSERNKTRWIPGVGTAHVNVNEVEAHIAIHVFRERENGDLVTTVGASALIQKP